MKTKLFALGAACALMLAGCGGNPSESKTKVTGVTLSQTSATLEVDGTLQLYAYVEPEYADNTNVTWSASGDGIVSVDDGLVTALKVGESTVTVTTVDGGYTATCAITVNPKGIPVTGVYLDKTTATVNVGSTVTLTATVQPDNATNKNVSWTSSDESVATVVDGVVTGHKDGTATIKVMTYEGIFEASCTVTVNTDILFSGETAKSPDTWVYWNDQNWTGSTVSVSEHVKFGNKVTFTYAVEAGYCEWGFQVFYKNSQLSEGASYRLTAKVNSTVAVADKLLKINGTYVTLAAGENNIAVKYVEGGATASSFQFVASTAIAASNTFVISDWEWEGILDIPGAVAVNADQGTISFVPVDGAASYLIRYYDADKNYLDSESVAATGAALTKFAALADGNYYVSAQAISSLEEKYDSIESTLVLFKKGSGSVVPAGGPKNNIVFGEEANLPLDKFVFWNANWDWGVGGQVNIAEGDAYTEEGLLHIAYTAEGNCAFGLQIFYKNSELKTGTTYTVSFKMKVAVAGDYGILTADSLKTIPADTWTEVSYEYTEAAGAASLKVLASTTIGASNVIEMKDFAWAAK